MKIWLSGEGTDISWSNLWGLNRLWVVFLIISWAWNNPSKNTLILRKKTPSSIPSCATKIPLHCAQIPLQKWGIRDVTVGIFKLLVPIHGAGACEKRNQ
jgi:hypothetical protein